jgi:hypothetical protein
MASKSVKAHARSGSGDELVVQAHDTDALILPVAQLEALNRFRPDLIDVVIEETRAEAHHRRTQEARINRFVFIERVLGQVSAIVLAIVGVSGALYAGLNGATAVGIAIVTTTIGTLAVTMVARKRPPEPPSEPPNRP